MTNMDLSQVVVLHTFGCHSGNPLRPIVTCIGSALYNTSKFLTDILSPLQNPNGYSVANSLQFSKELSNIEIDGNEILVSFDVVSLFTAIPVDKACVYIKKKLEQDATLPSRTNLDIDDITKLLQFTLSNNYVMFNNRIYKQVHGSAMGSPVSPIVANLCMEEIEESAISISSARPKIWKRQHMVSTASSLLHRALNLPNSSERKRRELNYVQAALESNGYPSSFIKSIHARKTRASTTNVSPEELVGMFFKMVEPTESRKSFASLPYIKGVTEPLTRILKKHDVTVVNKPFTTLQQQFPTSPSTPNVTKTIESFWKSLKDRGLWQDEMYVNRKTAAGLSEIELRELLPQCVLEDTRKRYPNPPGVPKRYTKSDKHRGSGFHDLGTRGRLQNGHFYKSAEIVYKHQNALFWAGVQEDPRSVLPGSTWRQNMGHWFWWVITRSHLTAMTDLA
ncbi:uncharacterized protein [Montipora foliosa]|uniref:uncharacterized protein n=1 Tax=Montipora foliosa TaxID=591990 RepID=UPI0035F12F2B